MATVHSTTLSHAASTPAPARRWPVLARIPDVKAPTPATAGRTEYRFDPPQALAQQSPQRHEARRASRVLPSWDPFTTPAGRLSDAFHSAARLVALVVLLAVAGASLVLLRATAPDDVSAPDELGTAAAVEPAPSAPEPPTAIGPLGAATERKPAESPQPDVVASAEVSNPPAATIPEPEVTLAPAMPVYPTTPYPAHFADADASGLPRVRTSEGPPPVARLEGTVLEPPTRHATHDGHESSIY